MSSLDAIIHHTLQNRAYRRAITKRFWAKVRKTRTCWTWEGACDRKGYGRFSVGPWFHPGTNIRRNTMTFASHVSWILQKGPIPAGNGFHGTCVLHRCDNPNCVNPRHLFLGSNADNIRDMHRKGRCHRDYPFGEDHPRALLTNAQVRHIKSLLQTGRQNQRQIARQFGVGNGTINHIKTGRQWARI